MLTSKFDPGPPRERDQPASLLTKISRRRFARDAAAVAATSLSSAPSLLGSGLDSAEQQAGNKPQNDADLGLTAEQVQEVDARLAGAMRNFGDRLSNEQRQRLRRILVYNEKMLASIRAFHLENGDPPASVLKYFEDGTDAP